MARLLFEKTGRAIWISHLDLMRLFQRAFKRAGLPLKHTQGFNPRPSVSIALPLSVGVESRCELLDFDLEGCEVPCGEIVAGLNASLVEGVVVRDAYTAGKKLRELAFLSCTVNLIYEEGIPPGCLEAIRSVFCKESLPVNKKSKNGPVEQDIIPLILELSISTNREKEIVIHATIPCQNPSMNPMQLAQAVEIYAPEFKPDRVSCSRNEIYDTNKMVFR